MHKKILYSVTGIIVAIAIGTGSYILIQQQMQPKTSTNQQQNKQKGTTKPIKKHVPKNPSTSFKSNIDFNLQIPPERLSLNLTGKNLKLLSFEKGLKQRIAADKIQTTVQKNEREEAFSFKKIDIISNEENVYFKIGKNNIAELLEKEGLKKKFTDFLKTSEFIKIDNSQKILKILGNLGNKELISEIAKGFASSNPQAYFEKYSIKKKLANKLFHKGFYKILFKEKKQKNDKTYLAIKEKNCDIVEDTYKNISSMNPNISSENFQKEQCLVAVKKANKIIGEHLYVTKQQNKETIHYKGIANFELSYKKGKIINFELNTPIGLHSEYKDNHLSINFASEFLNALGHNLNASAELDIKENISGKINIDYKSEKFGKANLSVQIKKNKIKQFSTKGNIKDGHGSKLIFQGKGNQREGKLKAKISRKDKTFGTAIINYDKSKTIIKITSSKFNLITLLKENSLQWQTKLNIPNKLDLSSSGKIRKKNWWIKSMDIEFESEYQQRSPYSQNSSNKTNQDFTQGFSQKTSFYGQDSSNKTNQDFSLKYQNNNLNLNRDIKIQNEVMGLSGVETKKTKGNLSAKGKLKYNNTDINFLYKMGGGKAQGNIKHKNNNLTSTIDINPPTQKEFTIKTNGEFIFELWNKIKLSSNIKISDNMLKTRKNKSKQSRKLNDIENIQKALLIFILSSSNPTTALPTEGLTHVKYKGKIISYQGTFDKSYFQTLQQSGFYGLSKPPKTPQGRPYIISIGKNKRVFQIGTIINQNNSTENAIRGSYASGEKKIEKDITLPSLIYKGEIENGNYQISKTKLQNPEDIKGFVKDDGNNPLIYQPNNKNSQTEKKKEEDMEFNQIGAGIFQYNKEKNDGKTQINSSAELKAQGNTILKASLKGNYSKGGIQYYTPSEFTEKTLPGLTTLKLPNFSSFQNTFPTQKIMLVGVGGGILSATLIPRITGTKSRAKDTVRKAHLNQISTALSIYFGDEGLYPKSSELQKIKKIKEKLVPIYIKSIPTDPKEGKNYYYASIKKNGAKHAGMILVSKVENPNNGNFSAPDIQDLGRKINNKEAQEIEEMLKERGNFYIVVQ